MYFALYCLLDKNSFHPSINSKFSPWKLFFNELSWENNCLQMINRRFNVDLPLSVILGKSSFNLYKNLIQFIWQCNCFYELSGLNWLFLWWSCLTLFFYTSSSVDMFLNRHLSLLTWSIWFSFVLVPFFSSWGTPF